MYISASTFHIIAMRYNMNGGMPFDNTGYRLSTDRIRGTYPMQQFAERVGLSGHSRAPTSIRRRKRVIIHAIVQSHLVPTLDEDPEFPPV